jgi:long-chain acyl-CoA synthetase
MLDWINSHEPNPRALNVIEDGQWHAISTQEMLSAVQRMALGLVAHGINAGDFVAIMAHPSPTWVITDLAIMSIGAVTIPLFANISEENFLFEIEQTGCKALCIGGSELWHQYERHSYLFDLVINLEGSCPPGVIDFSQLQVDGQQLEEQNPHLYTQLKRAVQSDQLATVIYTSGSTGMPKGVELTHQNLVALAHLESMGWDQQNDRYLSILPLAHIFGRILNFIMLAWGIPVYYSHDLSQLGAICQQIHPTILVVVPRLLEKVYAKIAANIQRAGYMKRTLGHWAFELAHQEQESFVKSLMYPLADKIVYSTFREALGGSLRVVICGGAHLNPHLAHFFVDIGMPIYEGWGLTEASTVACNLPGHRKIGTVGPPLGDIEVKISPLGELLVRGRLVMRGYYKNPEATAEALDSEGWLHTGDKGAIDKDGFVTITGRMKEMYKTSTGEWVVPVPIEQALCKVAFIDMAMVIGQDRKFVSCLLFPDRDVLHSMKNAHAAEHLSDEEFLQGSFISGEVERLLESINRHHNPWERIHAYRFVFDPLTVESGVLTPSMKIRRDVLERKYSNLIDEMYLEH